jgi:mevalonate kinase
MRRSFAPAKIILSGEYAVIYGYPGIAVPADVGITAMYEENFGRPDLKIHWSDAHPKWLVYVQKIINLCAEENRHLFGTLTIECDAPLGKGMGASTALIIAVTRALLGKDCVTIARLIEDELNPGHSGIDFETIWYNQPIEFRKGEESKIIRLEKDLLSDAELINTGTPEEATPELVAWMHDQSISDERAQEIESALQTIGRCTERIIQGEDIKSVIRDHHRAQVALGVVPKEVQKLIKNIEQDRGAAKVIGAGGRTGGGGMVLSITY